MKHISLLPQFGLGTSKIASLGNRLSQDEAANLFNQALEIGVTVIDTSDTYGSGDSERMISKAIFNNRNEFFLITKAGLPYMSLPGFFSPINQIGKKVYQKLGVKKKFSKDYLVKSLHKSLARLKTDSVQVFLLHEPEISDLLRDSDFHLGLKKIKEFGMAQYVGISTNDVAAFDYALSKEVVDVVQTGFPFGSEEKVTVLSQARDRNIPIIANQIFRYRKTLLNNSEFMSFMKNEGLDLDDLPSLLISYCQLYADCILIGTKNPEHLKTNINGLAKIKNPTSLYNIISGLNL